MNTPQFPWVPYCPPMLDTEETPRTGHKLGFCGECGCHYLDRCPEHGELEAPKFRVGT